PREAAAVYRPVIHRITASGMVATTVARIWAVRRTSWDNSTPPRFFSNIRICLPGAHEILPLNSRTQTNVAVLPWGAALQVTGEDEHFDHLFNYVPRGGDGLVILTMHEVTHTPKNGAQRKLVEVRLDGERVGQMTTASSAHFLPSISHATDVDKTLGVWARIRGSGLAAELVVQGARATELDDSWLNSMPTFPALVDEAASYAVPPAFVEKAKTERSDRNSTSRSENASKPARGAFRITDKDRRYNPRTHRLAGVAAIILGVLVGGLLGAIPVIGPVLFIGCVVLGIMRTARSRKVAVALEEENSLHPS
ncbi:MAG: hypothetical protein ABS909_02485, partial [Arthrobacter sp.]